MHTPSEVSEARPGRRRVLFVAEVVTLAHLARPLVLARSLDPARYEVHFACAPRYGSLIGDLPFPLRPIRSISTDRFLTALARGAPLYDAATLRDYVEEDLSLLRDIAPDVVVGDFRLSLSVSARLTGTPYVTIGNAYWSPHARVRFPMPEIALTKVTGLRLGRVLFRILRPLAFALHARPLNRVRRQYGLPSLGLDLRRVYTDADYTLYADVPELTPIPNLPDNHDYLGPILWSPQIARPDWWDEVPSGRPIVYVTLGSSGEGELLQVVLSALADLPVSVLVATAGQGAVTQVPPNAWVAEYLPGTECAARAHLVICNGGSPTTHQALAAGKPVLGIPSNMDQHLNIEAVRCAGAGETLRAGQATLFSIRDTVTRLLADSTYRTSAAHLARAFALYDAPARFQNLLEQVSGENGGHRHVQREQLSALSD